MASTRASLRRIGILDQTREKWAAGASYTRMLIESLSRACKGSGVDLMVFTKRKRGASGADFGAPIHFIEKPRRTSWQKGLHSWLGRTDKLDFMAAARSENASVLLPVTEPPLTTADVGTIGWLADFQHVYLPESFPKTELKLRDEHFRSILANTDRVMLSSHSAERNLAVFAPQFRHKARVVSFPSLFAFDPPAGEPLDVRSKFHLPGKFALVANQFWQHKNHLAVVEAVRLLSERGIRVPVVMTGLPSDYRDIENRTVSQVLQAVATGGLAGQVILLGKVDYADLVSLMRVAAVTIQPSRFEGWSTTVQDVKALGRPVICSDIEVHREQAPGAIGFFPCDEPSALAGLLAQHWSELTPGPDLEAEAKGLTRERDFATEHGQALLRLCREVCGTGG